MTAEEFWNRNKNAFMFRPFSVVMRFAEAYASHVTASQDARVERLEKALSQLILRANDAAQSMMACQTAMFGCRPGLSDAIVIARKALEDGY